MSEVFLMIAGRDFPSLFEKDNFKSRRTTGHNMLDPESLITGAEIEAGFTYANSARDWLSPIDYYRACHGRIPVDQILILAPRIFINSAPQDCHDEASYQGLLEGETI